MALIVPLRFSRNIKKKTPLGSSLGNSSWVCSKIFPEVHSEALPRISSVFFTKSLREHSNSFLGFFVVSFFRILEKVPSKILFGIFSGAPWCSPGRVLVEVPQRISSWVGPNALWVVASAAYSAFYSEFFMSYLKSFFFSEVHPAIVLWISFGIPPGDCLAIPGILFISCKFFQKFYRELFQSIGRNYFRNSTSFFRNFKWSPAWYVRYCFQQLLQDLLQEFQKQLREYVQDFHVVEMTISPVFPSRIF